MANTLPDPPWPKAQRLRLAAVAACLFAAFSTAQTLPGPEHPVIRAEFVSYVCPASDPPVIQTEAERARFEMRARYRTILPAFLARVDGVAEAVLVMPVDGVRVSQVADTWHAPRGGGRRHEGQDLFAPRGTPVRAAAPGFIYRIDDLSLGGLSVTTIGGAGRRVYYTHLDAVPDGLSEGQWVTVGTLIGFVGNSGNAASTPPHLHLGVYDGRDDDPCAWVAVDPLPLLVDRP